MIIVGLCGGMTVTWRQAVELEAKASIEIAYASLPFP